MTFDNSKTIISIRIKLFAATVVLLAYLTLAYVAKLIKFPLIGLNDTIWTLILIGIWIILAILPMILNYQFISYSDEGDFLIFRYFTAGIIGGKKNCVEIHKSSFSGYKIEKRLSGLIVSIILFQKFQKGVAKYPPIYISVLTREESGKLIRSLKEHMPAS